MQPPLYTVTYTCILCHRVFTTERAIANHHKRNAVCIQRQVNMGYRRQSEDDDWAFPDDEEDEDDDAEGAGQPPPPPPAPDPAMVDLTAHFEDADAEDKAVETDKVTGLVVRALLTAGVNKGPLPAHGQQTVLDLIHNPLLDREKVLVKNPEDVRKFIKILVDSDDCLLEHLDIELQADDPLEWKDIGAHVYGTNALEACLDMVKSEEAASLMEWECGGLEDGITSPVTGDRARRRQQALKEKALEEGWGEDVHYVPVTFFSDKTHLNVRGTHKSHPGFLKLCGWKQPFCSTRRAARLIVLLPDPPSIPWDRTTEQGSKFASATAWKDYLKMRKQDLHHAALESVLIPLKAHSRYHTLRSCFVLQLNVQGEPTEQCYRTAQMLYVGRLQCH